MTDAARRRIVVGLSGASAPHVGLRVLEALRFRGNVEIHLIVTKGAVRTLQLEAPGWTLAQVRALADVVHDDADLAAPPSSGSFLHDGMAIVPASIRTCSALAAGITGSLLTRAADVTLKERRPLVLAPRESPLHLGHLRTLTALAELGAAIVPPMLAMYHAPTTVQDLIDHAAGKVLDLLKVEHDLFRRWSGG
ncbi:MAG TPA: UbiX family flavin prenyltransferase [Planctomycetota bacterium]|nr:UbiX family flavin prenyltransferase [Planctomycetota bacterium]